MSKKLVVVHRKRPAKPHEIARARGQVNIHNVNGPTEDDDLIGYTPDTSVDIGPSVPSNVITSNPKRVSKKDFYSFRDSVYKMIKELGKDAGKIPGNPFSKYSHDAIKDSEFKNYASELAGFKELVRQYFPEVYSKIQNIAVQTENRILNSVLPEGDAEQILKAAGRNEIDRIIAKASAGQTLSAAEKIILDAYLKLNDAAKRAGKDAAENSIGEFILGNWQTIAIGVAIIVILIILKKK